MRSAVRSTDQDLQVYNLLVLQHQDEAFNLAYALLGNETLAEKIVGSIFHESFKRIIKNGQSFRSELLAEVVFACLRQGKLTGESEGVRAYLVSLTNIEKAAVVLVDSMEMDLADAVGILKISRLQLVKLLASGRSKIAQALPEAF